MWLPLRGSPGAGFLVYGFFAILSLVILATPWSFPRKAGISLILRPLRGDSASSLPAGKGRYGMTKKGMTERGHCSPWLFLLYSQYVYPLFELQMIKKTSILFIALSVFLLTGCTKYTVQVDLPDAYRQELEQTIVDYQQKIKDFDPSAITEDATNGDETASTSADSATPAPEPSLEATTPPATSNTADDMSITIVDPDGTTRTVSNAVTVTSLEEVDTRPPFAYFLEVALAQEKLGRLGQAINTYKKVLKLYENSQVAWHNLGRIYERVGKYDKAVDYYAKIIDQFGFVAYNMDIANAYIKKGDLDAAQKAYNQYRILTNLTDPAVEQYLTNLRKKK